MRIGIVHPVRGGGAAALRFHTDQWQAVAGPDTEVVTRVIDDGPDGMLTLADAAHAGPHIVDTTRQFRRSVDAVIINCFCDPALADARAVAEVPVIGVGESSMFFASQVAARFAITTVVAPSYLESVMAVTGRAEQLAAVHLLDLSVQTIRSDPSAVVSTLERAAHSGELAGAEALCLGCCALSGLAGPVEEALGIAVIDPKAAAMKMAEASVDVVLTGRAVSATG